MGYQPIENYGIIGDLNIVVLIDIDGSIDISLSFLKKDLVFCQRVLKTIKSEINP